MKLYIANGTYVGTQADARAITKQFTEVDVPTDKPGLIAFLNGLCNDAQPGVDDFETIVTRNDPQPTDVNYTDASVDLDRAFLGAPLGQQLTLAQLALEAARNAIGKSTTPAALDLVGIASEADREAWEDNVADDDEPTEDPFA